MEHQNDHPDYAESGQYKLSGQRCFMYGCTEAAIVGNFGTRLCLQHQELASSISYEAMEAANKFRPKTK